MIEGKFDKKDLIADIFGCIILFKFFIEKMRKIR